MSGINFDGLSVVITGAGGGLGATYAKFLASRGARVVVNDLQQSCPGPADKVVADIIASGGKAVADYSNVLTDALHIIQTAIQAFGRVDVVINNAGILRDMSFHKMDTKAWEVVQDVHVRGSFEVTKAAWPYMVKQKFGRIVMTASPAGVYGNFGQANYAAAKHALLGMGLTLAREGARYGIMVNTIVPVAASRMTESVLPPEVLKMVRAEYVTPLVSYLSSKDCSESGGVFECAAGYYAKLRWQRTKGAVFKLDDSYTPGTVQARWSEIADFDQAVSAGNIDFPVNIQDDDWMGYLEQATHASNVNPPSEDLRFDGKVAVVTGAGSGLGRAYAMLLGKLGAKVVVNDLGGSRHGVGASTSAADQVVAEIKAAGGAAVANYDSVADGAKIIQTAIDSFGEIHILVNNAGILIDKSFTKLTSDEFNKVYAVHLSGSFETTRAAWPYMLKQKYGRIVNTTSAVGLFGNFGQANYAAAKSGIIGFSNALAIEGQRKNVLVNVIAPNAGTRILATVLPPDVLDKLRPEYVAPLVGYLCHESNETTKGVFQVGSGWISRLRWERAKGHFFSEKVSRGELVAPEHLHEQWGLVTEFDGQGRGVTPESAGDSFQSIYAMAEEAASRTPAQSNSSNSDKDQLQKSLSATFQTSSVTITDREVLTYNLSVSNSFKRPIDLRYVNELDDNFSALPTFAVILAMSGFGFEKIAEVVPGFDLMNLLHGEQYFEIKDKLPTEGNVKNSFKVVDILAKGKHSILLLGATTECGGNQVCYNEMTLFIKNTGGFGNKIPQRKPESANLTIQKNDRRPDMIIESPTLDTQALWYRLNGDRNPLHLDPMFASMAGFEQPILHGLCTFGITGKAIVDALCGGDGSTLKKMKGRFTSHVFPGETLVTRIWKEGARVRYETQVKEREKVVINAGVAEIEGGKAKL